MKKIKIALIDDEELFLNGISELLSKVDHFEIFKTYTNPHYLLKDIEQKENEIDVVLVDMKMPQLNGIDLTKFIIAKNTNTKVIGLSSYYSNVLIFQMLNIGAAAFLPKNTNIEKLIRTIEKVSELGFYFEDIILKAYENKEKNLIQDANSSILTEREIDVLHLICEQNTTHEIAEKLFISNKTVERHRTNLFEKTEAKNVVGLVLFALKNNLISHSFL